MQARGDTARWSHSTAATALVLGAPLVAAVALQATGVVTSEPLLIAGPVVASFAATVLACGCWRRRRRGPGHSFGDLMLWRWLRHRRLHRELDRAAATWPELDSLAGTLEDSHPGIQSHSRRVARHAAALARAHGLSDEEVARVHAASLVHDIGKVRTPRTILTKPAPLGEEERAILRDHANAGAEMVSSLGDPELAAMVRHHHERPDGKGYPKALRGEEIPLGARIVAVADVFDALVSERSYRAAMSHREALSVLRSEAGKGLDAACVDRFVRRYSGHREVFGWAGALALAKQLATQLRFVPVGSIGASQSATASLAVAAALVATPAIGPGAAAHRPLAAHPHAVASKPAARATPTLTPTPGAIPAPAPVSPSATPTAGATVGLRQAVPTAAAPSGPADVGAPAQEQLSPQVTTEEEVGETTALIEDPPAAAAPTGESPGDGAETRDHQGWSKSGGGWSGGYSHSALPAESSPGWPQPTSEPSSGGHWDGGHGSSSNFDDDDDGYGHSHDGWGDGGSGEEHGGWTYSGDYGSWAGRR